MTLTLTDISKTFADGTRAVRPTDLKVAEGEIVSLLGPSGCGKTTLLRMIAGLESPDAGGQIRFGDLDVTAQPVERRQVGMVFQSYALFPNMSLRANVGDGLRMQKLPRAEIDARVEEVLALCRLEAYAERAVTALSGGQRQRVALARAIAPRPRVLLLDEPLSALDLKLRQHMRTELREIQKRVGITFIYITHDQGEALTMSDNVAVMKAGVIEQIDTGHHIYDDPSTPFVASFVGENNVFRGKVKQVTGDTAMISTNRSGDLLARVSSANQGKMKPGDDAMMFIRPEAFALAPVGTEGDHFVTATVTNEEFEGNSFNIFMEGEGGKEMKVSLPNLGQSFDSHKGQPMTLQYDVQNAVALPAGDLATE